MKKVNSHKNNILILLAVILAVAVWVFMVWLVNKEATLLHQTIKAVEEIDTKRENLVTVKKNVDSVRNEAQVLNSYFFSADEVVSFIERFEALKNKLAVSFEVEEIKEGENVLDLSFRVVGTESQVITFIETVEDFPFALKFNQVLVKELGQTEEGVAGWQGDVSLSVLSFE